jgi:hypothetical protein
MKTLFYSTIFLAVSAALAADIVAVIAGSDGDKHRTILLTNDTTLVRFDWGSGETGGIQEINARLDRDLVVVTETGRSTDDDGIRRDMRRTTVVPTNKIPKEVVVGSTIIEILRTDQEKDK